MCNVVSYRPSFMAGYKTDDESYNNAYVTKQQS